MAVEPSPLPEPGRHCRRRPRRADSGPIARPLGRSLRRVQCRAGTRMYPKGSTENSRTMEHFRRLGLSRRITHLRHAGRPSRPTSPISRGSTAGSCRGSQCRPRREARDIVRSSPPTDQVPEPIFRANQMFIDQALLLHAATRANITLRFGWSVNGLEEKADGVALLVATRKRHGGALAGRISSPAATVRRAWSAARSASPTAAMRRLTRRSMVAAWSRRTSARRAVGGDPGAAPGWQYWTLNPQVRCGHPRR